MSIDPSEPRGEMSLAGTLMRFRHKRADDRRGS